ncbi:H-2 class I histocompatibility antigen, Q10 alpha chain-like [Megalobrama amblycephala]|uniref:H-2 class I histocompatibility antigen, Q10 alpha chain-like n=1 Tax=Megalobrama amblycephala TaxID=75352 RepID=UPI0020144A72|nr:H-2 class I histocompatibility antigen, Q10 alpha chain-like [Megalobrama amblycephala]
MLKNTHQRIHIKFTHGFSVMATRFGTIFTLLSVFLLYWTLPSIQAGHSHTSVIQRKGLMPQTKMIQSLDKTASHLRLKGFRSQEKRRQLSEKHSLYYIYTCLSKPVDLPGIYEFSAMGLLDDRPIDYYNSKDKRRIPKQQWMKEKMKEDYWEKGTESRKSKEEWFHKNINILMKRMSQSESDLHVLQWRVGCEAEGDEVKFSRGIDEYSYDGENFLSFDDKECQWVAPFEAALPTKRKWDSVPILNQYTKGYLEKECVDWLKRFRVYGDEKLRNGSPPDVHVFAKSTEDKTKLKLTCLATGFYPKDVMMIIRKYRTSLPEDEIESTGVRPNQDETFQDMKSVEIKEDERADYDCFVSHGTLKEPVITKWDGTCKDCLPDSVFGLFGVVIGAVIVGVLVLVVVFVLKKKRIIVFGRRNIREPDEVDLHQAGVPPQDVSRNRLSAVSAEPLI